MFDWVNKTAESYTGEDLLNIYTVYIIAFAIACVVAVGLLHVGFAISDWLVDRRIKKNT